VFNSGERVLAATSPIYAVFVALLQLVFHDPIGLAIYCWPFFVAASAVLAFRLVGGGAAGLAAALLLCTEPSLLGIVGMDTAFYLFILLLASWLFATQRLKAAALLLGALPVVRPDGIFLVASVGLVWLVENRRSVDRAFLRRTIGFFGLLLLPLAVWSTIAIAYYGSPVPQSFIGKYYQGKIQWWWPDISTFRHVFLQQLLSLRYGLVTAGALIAVPVAFWKLDRMLCVGCLWTVFYFSAYSIAHVPAYGNYFFPIYSMMTILALRSASIVTMILRSKIGGRSDKLSHRKRVMVLLAMAMTGLVIVWHRSDFRLFAPVGVNQDLPYLDIADYLRKYTPQQASVGVMEIGIIGYFSERKIVDFAGLATPAVAKAVAQGDLRFALKRFDPDYVVVRYPVPARLEGGLTEAEVYSNYKLLYATAGIAVVQQIRPDSSGHRQVATAPQLQRLEAFENTVFILRQPLSSTDLVVLNEAVAPRGDIVAVSYSASEHDIWQKRYSYLSVKEGHSFVIETVLEPWQVEVFWKPPRFEFDDRNEKFGAWKDTTVTGPDNSMLHVSITGPDPYVSVPVKPFAPWFRARLKLRVRVRPRGNCDVPMAGLLWVTDRDPSWAAQDKAVHFPMPTDGQWHELTINLGDNPAWNGSGIVNGLRYDPIYCPADLDLDWFRFE